MWGGARPERLWTLMPLPRRLRELRGKHGGRSRNLPLLDASHFSEGRRSQGLRKIILGRVTSF